MSSFHRFHCQKNNLKQCKLTVVHMYSSYKSFIDGSNLVWIKPFVEQVSSKLLMRMHLYDPSFMTPDEVLIFISKITNPRFDHLLESLWCDDSNKCSSMGFYKEIMQVVSIEVKLIHLIWSSEVLSSVQKGCRCKNIL